MHFLWMIILSLQEKIGKHKMIATAWNNEVSLQLAKKIFHIHGKAFTALTGQINWNN